jgi:hypothetical protein
MGGALADRIGPKRARIEPGPPLPPPAGQKLDPRAQRGASSYADLVRFLHSFSPLSFGATLTALFDGDDRTVRLVVEISCCLTELVGGKLGSGREVEKYS